LRVIAAIAITWSAACADAPVAPAPQPIDVLDFVVGDAALWPRFGNQHQHQVAGPSRVCWTKYTLPWMYECWRWDAQWIYHEVDHGIDDRRWEHYMFSDGRWLPRQLVPGQTFELIVAGNRITWVDADCVAQPERPAPYRVRAWYEARFDAGGDLGVRDVVVLEYQPDPANAPAGTAEHFYFARGGGWFLWTRGEARVVFNQIGGVVRQPAPLCRADFEGGEFLAAPAASR
jgi:hypothetical protein